jgi:hypothetical protein
VKKLVEVKPVHEYEIRSPFTITEGLKEWGKSEIGIEAMTKRGEDIKKLMQVE